MPFLLDNTPIQLAEATIERLGVWQGKASAAGVLDLAVGAGVELVLGDQLFVGYVVDGGTFPGGSESTYTLAGGAAGWTKPVPAKGYQIPTGVSLAVVAQELATAAGEQIDLGGLDQILGDHWVRPEGPASVALSALFPLESGGWRVDPDGVARPGPRPLVSLPAGLDLAVEKYVAATRWARIGLPGDNVSALLPGAIVTADNLATPIVVRSTTIKASAEAVTVEVLGVGGALELFVQLIQALTPSRVFNGAWTYQVAEAEAPGARPNLQSLARIPGLPAVLAADKVPGLPGASSTLAAGALVLVGFRDGSPARPFIVGYLPGVLPDTLLLDATTSISLGAGAVPLARADRTDAGLGVVVTALNALATATGHGGMTISPPPSVATVKAWGA